MPERNFYYFLSCYIYHSIYTLKTHYLVLSLLILDILQLSKVYSQVPLPDQQLIDTDVEEVIDRIDNYIPEENLTYYTLHPLDLNNASREEIIQFPLLNAIEAQLINDYLSKHRPLISVLELQSIKGISTDLLRSIMPYIRLNDAETRIPVWKSITQANKGSLVFRWSRLLQESKGYIPDSNSRTAYLGSPDKIYMKLRSAEPGRYSVALIAEKDAGEAFFKTPYIKGVDFISAHLFFENLTTKIKTLALGDYSLRLGQGLILDNGFSLGKTFQFGSVVKAPSIIKPYQSVRESEMFRGIATKLRLNQRASLVLFYSSKKVDGNIVLINSNDSLEVENRLSALQASGLHRSLSELEDKEVISVNYTGGAIDYHFRNLKLGLNGVYKKQNPAFSNDERLDRLFVSEDSEQYFSSAHHQWIFKNLTFCGEWAFNKNGNHALVQHVIIGMGKKAETMLSYRNFHPGFYSDASNTISSSTLSWNEKGLYLAINLSPFKKISMSGSADFSHFPWLKYQNDLLTSRREYSFRVQYTERKKWLAYVQFRKKDKELNKIFEDFGKEKEIFFQHGYQLRFHLESKLNSDWTWRVRVESHWISEKNVRENGLAISQDVLFKSNESKFSGNLRFAIFDISDYEARIYNFENDVLYQYSLPAYNGRGIRAYINLRYRPISRLTLESRLSNTYYFDENQNGTGQDLINSFYKTEVKIQIRYQF